MRRGFTLIEMIVVIALLGLAAALVIPQLGGVHSLRVQAALRTIVSDITFAQADAIAFQQRRAMVFDPANNRYRIVAVPGSIIDENNTLFSPSGPNGRYVVELNTEQFAGARITGTDFDTQNTLVFDDLGSPVSTPSGEAAGRGGTITLTGSEQSYTIVVEPFTGRVTVRKMPGAEQVAEIDP
ncbi:MAG: Tfp pilus assembly protein FimT/FimU [Phycisphaerales bacterium]